MTMLLTGVGGPRSSPAFTPASITGLIRWLDASDAATLFQDATLLLPATADGASVGGWKDKSPAAKHVTQAVALKVPILKTAIQNGKNIVRTDGTTYLAGGTVTTNGGFTIAAVIKATYSAGAVNVPIDCSTGNPGANNGLFVAVDDRGGSGKTKSFNVGAEASVTGARGWGKSNSYGATAWKIFATSYGLSASEYYSLNAVSQAPLELSASGTGVWIPGSGALAFGTLNDGTFGGATDFAEVCIYDNQISAGDLANLHAYLNSKWAIY